MHIGNFSSTVPGDMNQKRLSSRVYPLIRAAIAAAVLPVLFIYVMIAKPDYKLMNAAAHVVVPVARGVGDVITWPVRAVGNTVVNIRELANARAENEELRARLDAALAQSDAGMVALAENQRLNRELDTVRSQPQRAIIADITHDAAAFNHNTFFVSRGADDDISTGMVVVSMDGRLVGVITDVAAAYARVRAISDAASNIAVRIVGADVYGFVQGGGGRARLDLLSDPAFQPATGNVLVTSNISGILPAGIVVGTIDSDGNITFTNPKSISRVMILKFDGQNKYK